MAEPGSLGVVIGGSGNGEQIAANKARGARAALAWNLDTARLARQHNDANLVGIGARQHSEAEALAIVDAFLAEPFGQARHQRRIDEVDALGRLTRASARSARVTRRVRTSAPLKAATCQPKARRRRDDRVGRLEHLDQAGEPPSCDRFCPPR